MIEVKAEYEELKEHFVIPDGGELRAHDMYHLFQTFESLRTVAQAASLMRDAEMRLSKSEYKKGSVGHDFIGGQVLLWKTKLHEALDAVPAWMLEED